MRRKQWFAVAVGVQIAVLVIMIAMKWSTLAYGTKILLKTAPVDPWDVFRGDYVVLNYEISELDLNKVPSDNKEYKINDTVYISLVKGQGKYWVPSRVSQNRPKDGGLFIKGMVNYFLEYEKKLFVNYGLDSYYVPQHQGKTIENSARSALVDVEVSISSSGDSALSRLFLNGKEIKFQ